MSQIREFETGIGIFFEEGAFVTITGGEENPTIPPGVPAPASSLYIRSGPGIEPEVYQRDLTSLDTGWSIISGVGISEVRDDQSPELGGNLDTSGFSLESSTGDIQLVHGSQTGQGIKVVDDGEITGGMGANIALQGSNGSVKGYSFGGAANPLAQSGLFQSGSDSPDGDVLGIKQNDQFRYLILQDGSLLAIGANFEDKVVFPGHMTNKGYVDQSDSAIAAVANSAQSDASQAISDASAAQQTADSAASSAQDAQDDATQALIDAAGSVKNAINLGSGEGILESIDGDTVRLKSIVQGPGITITPSASELLIESSPPANVQRTVGFGSCLDVSTTFENTFLDKLVISVDMTGEDPAALVLIQWTFLWSRNSASADFVARVVNSDETEVLWQMRQEPSDAAGDSEGFGFGTNQRNTASGSAIIQSQGVQDYRLQWSAGELVGAPATRATSIWGVNMWATRLTTG